MDIIKHLISLLFIIDSRFFFLASIPATILHIKLIKKSFALYHHRFGRLLNWKNPTRFSEKIHLFKMSREAEKISWLADKYEVRSYVKKTIGNKYLIPLLNIYSSEHEIDLEKLPKSFVLKCTHGSNWNIICKDKSKLDWPTEKIKLHEWLNSNFYFNFAERQYRNIKARIVCEKFLGDSNGLIDYKFHCFAGKAEFIRIMFGRQDNMKRSSYDLDWNLITSFKYLNDKNLNSYPEAILPKPKNLKKMIEIAEKLSKPFSYVRVDLYNVKGQIFFGELTFTPNAGLDIHSPDTFDEKFGSMIKSKN